jgi:hypothetical protein
MALLDMFTARNARSLYAASATVGIASPLSKVTAMHPIVVADVFPGIDPDIIALSRAQAIGIPAVSKARNLLVSTIGKFPLRALTGGAGVPIPTQPTFLSRTESNVTPLERMAWTVDDLIFYGYSLWTVTRGIKQNGRLYAPIVSAEYVPFALWKIEDGEILINDEPVDELDVILFNSPFEGLLTIATRTLRGAIDQERTWVARARNPIPMTELHVTEAGVLEDSEIEEFVKAWSNKRRGVDGAVGYTPAALEIRTHGTDAPDMSVEGRNAIRTDIGSFLNIRASMLDGTMGIDSLTYSTTEGERNSFYEFDLPFWTDPIAHRLSMDDIVPRGTYIRFDMYDTFTNPAPTGPIVED